MIGNAGVSSQGTAELHLQTYRRECVRLDGGHSAAPGRNQRRRTETELITRQSGMLDMSAFVHAGYHAVRLGGVVGSRGRAA